jgi:hypothetical protein
VRRSGYTRPMRLVVVAVGMALLVGACSAMQDMEDKRAKRDQEFSAGRLDGKFGADDPIVHMLSPEERNALDHAGLMAEPLPPDEADAAAAGADDDTDIDGRPKTKAQKAGDVMMSVLTVGITLGMMAAPYLLF